MNKIFPPKFLQRLAVFCSDFKALSDLIYLTSLFEEKSSCLILEQR